MTQNKTTHHIDTEVGKRIRYRRWKLGMTQTELGHRIGVKFTQIQKYETGANRISASRLWETSKALSVPISFFFSGAETEMEQSGNVDLHLAGTRHISNTEHESA